MKKIVRKDNSRRKKILSISLVIFVFMGIGYSVISSNLLFNGNIQLSKYESPYLYDVLKKEALSGGLAQKYTGEHHDSFTEEPSKDIYHWYAANDEDGTAILDKNNVIFADHCWQMIRTTDTGGVKMIYNGEVENGQCLNTRGNHVGYKSRTAPVLSYNLWYGTDYTYDPVNGTFKVSGDTVQVFWDETTAPSVFGKYTCRGTEIDDECTTLYLVDSYYSETKGYATPIKADSHYSQFGATEFDGYDRSPARVGYMFDDTVEYVENSEYTINTEDYIERADFLQQFTLSTSYWFADSITYNSTTGYSLVNPYQVSSNSDLPNTVGKYTFLSDSSSTTGFSVYYIAKVNSEAIYNYMRNLELKNGETLSSYEPIIVGTSVTDNGNGTFTLNDTSSMTIQDYANNSISILRKYICDNYSSTCSNPRFVQNTGNGDYYYYLDASEKIMIAKSRNGFTLTDTLLVGKEDFLLNSDNYTDYKYTCNSDSANCTSETLREILSYVNPGYSAGSACGYKYRYYHYFGTSVTWDGTKYTLTNPILTDDFSSTNYNDFSTHHFMCIEPGKTSCQSVAYFYFTSSSDFFYYIVLENGVTSISDVLNGMLTTNTINSDIKYRIEEWYRHYMLDYDDYIEDTIFCNDRSISDLGGWDPNGGLIDEKLKFKEYTPTTDISCTNNTDKFSVSNNAAKLNYKVGLMSSPEMNLLNNNNARKTGRKYWLMSPSGYGIATNLAITTDGTLAYDRYDYVVSSYGLRPTISLKPGTEFIKGGDGSMANPFVVKTVNNCTFNGTMEQGAEFVDGQYTYRYMQEASEEDSTLWLDITEDGWGVRLTDPLVDDPITTKLCTTINNKPIVSMRAAFADSQATYVDFSSFDTSNVTSMSNMFRYSTIPNLDLRSFDTSKVISMQYMFGDSSATSIDLSSFETGKTNDMSYMFANSSVTNLDLSNFNTINVSDMSFMFAYSQLLEINMSNFSNSNTISVGGMLCDIVDNAVVTFGDRFPEDDDMTDCNFSPPDFPSLPGPGGGIISPGDCETCVGS